MLNSISVAICFLLLVLDMSSGSNVIEGGHIKTRSEYKDNGIVRKFTVLHKDAPKEIQKNNGCTCVNYTCGCCLHMEVQKINLNDTGCVNISYLPEEYGLEVDMILNGRVVFKRKVSAKNPPPICAEVPYVHKLGSVCLRFYNLSVSHNQFSACADLEVEFEHVVIKDFDFGCFHIPPNTHKLVMTSDKDTVRSDKDTVRSDKDTVRWTKLSSTRLIK